MGQAECLKLLQKKKEWLSTREIWEKLGQRGSVVSRSLRILFWSGDIERKNIDPGCNKKYEWRIK